MRPNLTGNPLFDALEQAALGAGQRRIHPETRTAVMLRDHRLCQYCGRPATEIDHVEPWSRGGLTVMSNLVAACQHCNRQKGDMTPQEWQRDKAMKFVAMMAQRRTRRGRIETAIRKSRPNSRSSLAYLQRPR